MTWQAIRNNDAYSEHKGLMACEMFFVTWLKHNANPMLRFSYLEKGTEQLCVCSFRDHLHFTGRATAYFTRPHWFHGRHHWRPLQGQKRMPLNLISWFLNSSFLFIMLLIGDHWNMWNYNECFMFLYAGNHPSHGAISSCVRVGWHLVMLVSLQSGGCGGQHWGENVFSCLVITWKYVAAIFHFLSWRHRECWACFCLPCMCPAGQVLDSICWRDFYNIYFVRVHVWSLQGMQLPVFIDLSQFSLVYYFVLRNS